MIDRLPRVRSLAGLLGFAILAAAAASTLAQTPEATPLEKSKAIAKAAYEAKLKKFGQRKDVFVRHGVFANSHDKTITLWGMATGLDEDAPVEFFMAGEGTGRDYEALTLIHAKPSDVHAALKYLGMQPGRPVNYQKLRFWPKGERVFADLTWTQTGADGKEKTYRGPIERGILDTVTKAPLSAEGLVFTGSSFRKLDTDGEATRVYAGDISASRSIGSTYNEPTTVLDIPMRAPQGQVYGRFLPNPKFAPPAGTPIQVVLRPEQRAVPRVIDLTITITAKQTDDGRTLVATVKPDEGQAIVTDADMKQVLTELVRLVRGDRSPFVQMVFADDLTVVEAAAAARGLGSLESDQGYRMDAPPTGQLYYRAFMPPVAWRDRATRGYRPWELELEKQGDKVLATLHQLEFNWNKKPIEITAETYQLEEPAKLKRRLTDEKMSQHTDLIVRAPADLTYGELKKWVAPVLPTHAVWVFLEKSE